MDHLEQNKRIMDSCMKKGLKKTNTYVGKLAGILLKLFTCETMGAQTKLECGDRGIGMDLREIQEFGLIEYSSRWLVREK